MWQEVTWLGGCARGSCSETLCTATYSTAIAPRLHVMVLPALPALPGPWPIPGWSANIQSAYQQLTSIFEHASSVLCHSDSDPLRIAFHINAIASDALPTLCAMEADSQSGPNADEPKLPQDWFSDIAYAFGTLTIALKQMKEQVQCGYVRTISKVGVLNKLQ
jgi:hypothetical protein